VELSDERSLVVEITLIGGIQVVNVSYYDPLLDEVSEPWLADPELSDFVDVQDAPNSAPTKRHSVGLLRNRLSSWVSNLIGDGL